MAVLIADTNLWVTASGRSSMTSECARGVLRFVADLENGDDRLAVDHKWMILGEYYRNLDPQDLAYTILNLFHVQNRIDFCFIEFDRDGIALVPPTCAIHDLSDRKLVAVALAHAAHPPIHNVSDEDWIEDEAVLAGCGVQVIHHCEAELRRRFEEKQRKSKT